MAFFSSLHMQAAVDFDDLACDVVGLIAQQEQDRFGDLNRCAETTRGNRVCVFCFKLVFDLAGHVRRDKARRHAINADIVGRDLFGQGLGQADDAGLRRRIIGLPANAAQAADR